ncbi:MAG: thiolase family protein [Bacillota bacterium]
MRGAVIVSGCRTPIGFFGGTIKDISATDLAVTVIKGAVERAGIDPESIDEVILGNIGQSSDAPNVARVAALKAGLPIPIPGYTVQRNCGSGLQAVVNAWQAIRCGEGDTFMVGGTENMSNSPYLLKKARWGYRLQHGELTDTLWEGLTDPVCKQLMGGTAENLAAKYGISRVEQDEYAATSHKKAVRAVAEGKFREEIVPVVIPSSRGGEPTTFLVDETPKSGMSAEKLGLYPTVFKENGTVTPGNACGMNDGASALVVLSDERAKSLGKEPMAAIRGWAAVAVDPAYMGIGPAFAIPKAVERAGVKLKDISLFEINEPFAAQILSVLKELPIDQDKVNVNGGAIALGHPVGASGARILVTLMYELKRRGGGLGVASLCIGGGQGIAMVVEV